MGVTIHYADGTEDADHSTDEAAHEHDARRIEGEFGNYYECADCGLQAVEEQLHHTSCE